MKRVVLNMENGKSKSDDAAHCWNVNHHTQCEWLRRDGMAGGGTVMSHGRDNRGHQRSLSCTRVGNGCSIPR